MPRITLKSVFLAGCIIAILLVLVHQQRTLIDVHNHLQQNSNFKHQKDKIQSKNTIDESIEPTELQKQSRLPWFIADDGYRPLPGSAIKLDIWPGPSNVDRIFNQLMIAAPHEDISSDNQTIVLKKIFLPEGVGSWQMRKGRHVFTKQKCPVNRCYYTDDVSDAESADAVMYKWGQIAAIKYYKKLSNNFFLCPQVLAKL